MNPEPRTLLLLVGATERECEEIPCAWPVDGGMCVSLPGTLDVEGAKRALAFLRIDVADYRHAVLYED